MTRALLKDRLQQGLFFVDGAMGTQLIESGAPAGCCHEFLCIETPQIIQTVHQQYINAGVDAIITNTFGANGIVLRRHGHENEVYTVNLAAARLAREVAGPEKYVLGGLGPCGDFLHPLGTITAEALTAAFIEQIKGLAEGDVDGFIIETMTAIEEVKIVIEAIQSVSPLPILVSLAYDLTGDNAHTMMGVSPAQAADHLAPLGIAALGFNCGTLDMDGYVRLARDYAHSLKDTSVLLLAEPNAGRPELEDGMAVYQLLPDDFAQSLLRIKNAGAVVLGGCCGTSPTHLEAAVKALRQ